MSFVFNEILTFLLLINFIVLEYNYRIFHYRYIKGENEMKKRNRLGWLKVIPGLFLLGFLMFSCQKDTSSLTDIQLVNNEIYSQMQNIYLWYDKLPNIDPTSFSDPNTLMDSLRYKTYDRWSFVLTQDEYDQYFVNGQMIGHGFLLGKDESDNVRILFVYPGTSAYNSGVRRGWIIKKVNGTAVTPDNVTNLIGKSELGIQNDYEFVDNKDSTEDINLTKEVININPVLYKGIINTTSGKTGYMVFQDFLTTGESDIDDAFNYFKDNNINNLIIDLRYNGGGSISVAEYLAGWITGQNSGQAFVKLINNAKHQSLNVTDNIPVNANSLNLSKVYFITTESTASASELLINGLKPYLEDVKLIGSKTQGKPVGMYAIEIHNKSYVMFPVSFKYTNADNVGDFFNGLAVDYPANDDVTHAFGDPQEGCLKVALNYINQGVSTSIQKSANKIWLLAPHGAISDVNKAF